MSGKGNKLPDGIRSAFTLLPHPQTSALPAVQLTGTAARRSDGLLISYALCGNLEDICCRNSWLRPRAEIISGSKPASSCSRPRQAHAGIGKSTFRQQAIGTFMLFLPAEPKCTRSRLSQPCRSTLSSGPPRCVWSFLCRLMRWLLKRS